MIAICIKNLSRNQSFYFFLGVNKSKKHIEFSEKAIYRRLRIWFNHPLNIFLQNSTRFSFSGFLDSDFANSLFFCCATEGGNSGAAGNAKITKIKQVNPNTASPRNKYKIWWPTSAIAAGDSGQQLDQFEGIVGYTEVLNEASSEWKIKLLFIRLQKGCLLPFSIPFHSKKAKFVDSDRNSSNGWLFRIVINNWKQIWYIIFQKSTFEKKSASN